MAQILTPDDAASKSACQTAIAIWTAMGSVVDMWSANKKLTICSDDFRFARDPPGIASKTSDKPTSRYKSGFDECIGDNALLDDPQEDQGPDPFTGSDLNVFAHTERPSWLQHNCLFVLLGTRPP